MAPANRRLCRPQPPDQTLPKGRRKLIEIFDGDGFEIVAEGQRRAAKSPARLGWAKSAPTSKTRGDGRQTLLTDHRVESDNHRVENLIRPIARNRKNAHFAGYDEGGGNWDSQRIPDLDLQDQWHRTLRIPHAHPDRDHQRPSPQPPR